MNLAANTIVRLWHTLGQIVTVVISFCRAHYTLLAASVGVGARGRVADAARRGPLFQTRKRIVGSARWLYKEAFYWQAVVDGRVGGAVTIGSDHKATLIVPSYHLARARNLDPIVRNALRCEFIQRVIISNHNPSIRLKDWVKTPSDRLTLVDQPIRRGCGYGWIVASQNPASHYLVIDDDTIPQPKQLAELLKQLLADPSVPHGMAGWQAHGEFVERREAEVECVFNVYAVTRQHVERYVDFVGELTQRFGLAADTIEFYADDLVISQTGDREARVHDLGWVLRCRTSNREGIAISKDQEFWPRRLQVLQALRELKSNSYPGTSH